MKREQYNYFRSPLKNTFKNIFDNIADPKYDVGDPNGKPYICNITSNNTIYLNCLLYGKDEEDVKNKINGVIKQAKLDNMEYMKDKTETAIGYDEKSGEHVISYVYDYYTDKIKRIEELLPLLTVTEADLTKAFKIGWASNDTLF